MNEADVQNINFFQRSCSLIVVGALLTCSLVFLYSIIAYGNVIVITVKASVQSGAYSATVFR